MNKEIRSGQDVSPTFCILPWIHVSTKTNGEMRLCCTTSASSADKKNDKEFGGKLGVNRNASGVPTNLGSTNLISAWNNDYMKKVRRQMLSGEKPVSCSKCFKEEAAGVDSKRIWETRYWSERLQLDQLVRKTKPDGTVPEKIYYLDLRFGNLCNLKCVMCSPHDSSLWSTDWRKLYPRISNPDLRGIMSWDDDGKADGASYQWHENEDFWIELYKQVPHIQQLYFAGGEPLLIRRHYTLLKECIRQGYAHKITLRYNSNGTHLPEEILELWKSFQRVRFGFSMDCYGDKNTYIRYPSPWDRLVNNLRRLDETGDNIEVTLACAVQMINMFYLPEFIQWKLSEKFKKINAWPSGAGLINFHFVYHPANLNVKVYPNAIKEEIRDRFELFFDWLRDNYNSSADFQEHPYGIRRLRSMVKFMFSEDWSNRLPQFQEYIGHLDTIRGTSFAQTFPELAQLLLTTNKENFSATAFGNRIDLM